MTAEQLMAAITAAAFTIDGRDYVVSVLFHPTLPEHTRWCATLLELRRGTPVTGTAACQMAALLFLAAEVLQRAHRTHAHGARLDDLAALTGGEHAHA